MTNLDNLNSWELQELLNKLKLYKNLTSNLWNRGKKLFNNIVNNKHSYKVEYFPVYTEEEAKKQALEIYKKVFKEDVLASDLELIKKESLKWWIKVFKDDNLVDLSFKKAWEIFK
jgi:hypothetical protein